MSVLTDLIAGMSAGQFATLNLTSDLTNGYAESLSTPITDGPTGCGNLSQSVKCVWDWTPWRTYGDLDDVGVWVGYRVNHGAGYTAGTTSIVVDSGTKKITAGDLINFQNVPGTYTVVTGCAAGGGTITITPALAFTTLQPAPLVDNAQVAITHSGRRMFFWGHCHTAANNPWASFCCYEEYDNTWRLLPSYRHLQLVNTDVPFEDIMFSYFHQNSGISVNPGGQIFYRQFNSNNPSVISRVRIDEFDPTDIGKFTTRALTGTVTMNNGSQTVSGSGTLFNTQVRQGDQIWLNGDTTFYGLPVNIITVSSVESNTSLTCYNVYKGTAAAGAASVHDAYDLETHWGWEPATSFGAGPSRVSCEYWPDRDSLIGFNAYGAHTANGVFEKKNSLGSSASWTQLFTDPTLDTGANGGDCMCAHYNTVRHTILLIAGQSVPGGDSGDGGVWLYELSMTDPTDPIDGGVTLTRLDNMPLLWTGGRPGGGLVWHDPMNGKYYFVGTDYTGYPNPPYGSNPYLYGEIDASKTLGTQYTQLDGSVIPALNTAGTITVNTACGVMWDLGAVMFMTNYGAVVFKQTANNRARDGLTSLEKANGPGVIGSVRFGDNFVPRYTYSGSQDPIYLAAMSGRPVGSITNNRVTGESNIATENFAAPLHEGWVGNSRAGGGDGVCIPDVDTSVTYKTQPGSMRMTKPRQTGDNVGWCQFDIDGGIGTGHNHKIISPASWGLGTNFYLQYPIRVNPYMLVQYEIGGTGFNSPASIASPGATTVSFPGSAFEAAHIGHQVYCNETTDTRWIPGFYTITNVFAPDSIQLDRCPVIAGTTATFGNFLGPNITAGYNGLSGGFKTDLVVGNAPFGESSSTNIEVTTVFNNKVGSSNNTTFYPEMYGLKGNQGYGDRPMVGPLVADTWTLYDKSIRLKSGTTNTVASGRRGYRWADWTSGGAASKRIHSATFQAQTIGDSFWLDGGWVFISGYGPRSTVINASPWVPGLYEIDFVDGTTGDIVLFNSPTPSAAGTEGDVWILTNPGDPEPDYILHQAALRVNGSLAVQYNHAKIRMAPAPGDPDTTRYGIGQVILSIFHTAVDATFDSGGTAYTYYGHVTMATQPIPYLTADSVPSEATTGVRFFRHQVRK